MSEPRVLVVMPTYNERENLPRVVPLVVESHPAVEILVVDDASPDGTGALAEDLAREEPRIHVLHREGKGGSGGAYIAGCHWGVAREYHLFFEMDAARAWHTDFTPSLLANGFTPRLVLPYAGEGDLVIFQRAEGGAA